MLHSNDEHHWVVPSIFYALQITGDIKPVIDLEPHKLGPEPSVWLVYHGLSWFICLSWHLICASNKDMF